MPMIAPKMGMNDVIIVMTARMNELGRPMSR